MEKLKENEKFRSDYLAMNLHDFDIREEGREEGRNIPVELVLEELAKDTVSENMLG